MNLQLTREERAACVAQLIMNSRDGFRVGLVLGVWNRPPPPHKENNKNHYAHVCVCTNN